MHGLQLTQRDLVLATGAFLLLFVALGMPLSWRREVAPDLVAASAVLALALAVLSAIDIYTYRLPDLITLPLAGRRIRFHLVGRGAAVVVGGVGGLGFAALAGVAYAYRRLRTLRPGAGRCQAAGGIRRVARRRGPASGAAVGHRAGAGVRSHRLLARPLADCNEPPSVRPVPGFATWLVWLYGPL
jgi:prepilin signal peptidase PulO-like enzyme (type II secretory pathway)